MCVCVCVCVCCGLCVCVCVHVHVCMCVYACILLYIVFVLQQFSAPCFTVLLCWAFNIKNQTVSGWGVVCNFTTTSDTDHGFQTATVPFTSNHSDRCREGGWHLFGQMWSSPLPKSETPPQTAWDLHSGWQGEGACFALKFLLSPPEPLPLSPSVQQWAGKQVTGHLWLKEFAQ